MKKKVAAIMLTGAIALTTACGSSNDTTTGSVAETTTAETITEQPSSENPDTNDSTDTEADPQFSLENTKAPEMDLESAADPAAFTGEGMKVAFVRDPEFGEEIHDADMAAMAIYNNMDKIGAGDGSVILQYESTTPTETGVTYYSFNQVNNYVRVYGSSVKLIVDKNGKAIGLVSAIVPDLKVPDSMEANITAEDAEAIVKDKLGVNVISGATEEVLLPASEGSDQMYYAWVVYSRASGTNYDTPYTAHYVSKAGTCLYSMPVSEPGTMEAVTGNIATFAFDGGTTGTLETTITYSDGSEVNVEVPIMYDESGQAVLADPERGILCADYADYSFNDTLTPVKCGEGDKLVNSQIMDYYHFLLVYDFFDEIGWTGPDGEGTPSLLLMNMVDEQGEPVDNAFYAGKARGFQVFNFSDVYNYGETLDIMAHEFTHCFTSTTMTNNLYLNDMGAINEGMSDIIGNLVDIMLNGYSDNTWNIGDPTNFLRSMKDPHTHNQPEYVGDRFYLPPVAESTDNNDNGGVHVNSSLLNMISWYLDQSGMEASDQLYFWMNVALAMTPRTDYPQMAELLPWVMETSGYSQYVGAVEDAIEKTRIGLGENPDDVPEGCGKVRFTYDFNEIPNYEILVTFSSLEDNGDIVSWPAADTEWVSTAVPEGDYIITLSFSPKSEEEEEEENQNTVIGLYTEQGWYVLSYADFEEALQNYGTELKVSIEPGEVMTLETDSLKAALAEE